MANPQRIPKLSITENVISTTAPFINAQETTGVVNKINRADLIDVIEVSSATTLPTTGVAGKIYVTLDNGKMSRWNGTFYSELFSSKEDKSNKQNSLTTDGTGIKYATVDAVNNGLASKGNATPLTTETFVFAASQSFVLINTPLNVLSVVVNMSSLHPSQYQIQAPKTLLINDTLNSGDKITIVYNYSISSAILNISAGKIATWTNIAYLSGDQVNHLGKDWTSNAATLSTDIPATSSKWVERLIGYVDRTHDEKASKYINNGLDVKATANWINAILRADGTTDYLGGNYSFVTQEFFEVIPNVTTIEFYGMSSFGNEPVIQGYSKDKSIITNIKIGGSNLNVTFKGVVPDNVYYIRFATQQPTVGTFICKIVSKAQLTLNVFAKFPKQINQEDVFVGGLFKEHFNADGTATIGTYLGTGFVPVQSGDIIKYKGHAVPTIASLGAFDINKVFLKTILATSEPNTIYEIELSKSDYSNIAFVVGTHYQQNDPTSPFFTVKSSWAIEDEIKDLQDKAESKIINQTNAVKVTPYDANGVVAKNTVGQWTLEVVSGNGYFIFAPDSVKKDSFKYSLIKLEVELVAGVGAVLEHHGAQINGMERTFATIGQKNIFYLFDTLQANFMLKSSNVGAKFKITKATSMFVENKYFESYQLKDFYALCQKINFDTLKTNLADFASESNAANYLNTILKGGIYTAFGDSITALNNNGYVNFVSNYFKMNLTNLGIDGSTPQTNLTDARLALIPQGTKLVTITGGTNGWYVESGDVTSRDIATSQGVINHAIDYIEQNHPLAIIILITPPKRGNPPAKVQGDWGNLYKNIASYRGLVYADVEGNINWNVYNMPLLTVDNVHPSLEGNKRYAGVVIGAVNRVIY